MDPGAPIGPFIPFPRSADQTPLSGGTLNVFTYSEIPIIIYTRQDIATEACAYLGSPNSSSVTLGLSLSSKALSLSTGRHGRPAYLTESLPIRRPS
ncbi:hypothetical protein SKAU_G00239030 [Synaphobranchus kaupii]|uniref:Uncharacterized protein n=1 Tax=Synaphobranchus kaupii TaxID=118154 RepID=A0A9Q1F743_SYNKA|nr:hypothetical protein SKAU_G00239030 [Synaphobranchus kaupii]